MGNVKHVLHYAQGHARLFPAARGWGLFSQKQSGTRQTAAIDLKYGQLDLRTLTLAVPGEQKVKAVRLTLGGTKLPLESHSQTGQDVEIRLKQSTRLQAGDSLQILLTGCRTEQIAPADVTKPHHN